MGARCAGLRERLNLLSGNIVFGETSDDFQASQLRLIQEYQEYQEHRARASGRVALGRVIVPTDSAGPASRERYRRYAESRFERTLKPAVMGERRVLFARDLVGPAEQILEQLHADPVLAEVTELRLELPYEFVREDYEQILHDAVTLIGPELGWKPRL